MSRKHNARHERSATRYAERLAARGETAATVRMAFYDRWGRRHGTLEAMRRAGPSAPQEVPTDGR